jgi:hypothetical protein
MISKSDFENWLHDDVTRAVFDSCKQRVADAKDVLADNAGLDPANDNFYRGFVRAYSEVLGITYFDVEEDAE